MKKVIILLALGCVTFHANVFAQFEPNNGDSGFDTNNVHDVPTGDSNELVSFELQTENFSLKTTTVESNVYELGPAAIAPAPAPGGGTGAGPTEFYVYKNAMGVFKFPPVGALGTPHSGSASYRWFDGTYHKDRLTFIGTGKVTERDGHYIPIGTSVETWAFMAQDASGTSFFLYFGTEALIRRPNGSRRFPIYYSFEKPGKKTVIRRILTTDGTQRY